MGVQYHPEYFFRVMRPGQPHLGFVAASCELLEQVTARCAAGKSYSNGDAVQSPVDGGLVNGINGLGMLFLYLDWELPQEHGVWCSGQISSILQRGLRFVDAYLGAFANL
jgi:hypothetical protein